MKELEEKTILNALECAYSDMEKEQPETISHQSAFLHHSLIEVGFCIVPLNVLHEFFNHKSDANKYLDAIHQEELEKEFSVFIQERYQTL